MAFSLIKDVNAMLNRLNIAEGEPVVAGFSGGADSAALAAVLAYLHHKGRISAVYCHLNHQLRGGDAEADEQFVRVFSLHENIACEVKKTDVRRIAAEKGMNIEAAGRVCRYEWFVETARNSGARLVMLAHHADDQAETVIWRMIRGAGSEGLGGMRQVREEQGIFFGRPFLQRRKAELLAFCAEAGIGFRTDESNKDLTFTRNAIRHELMPLMETFNPNLVQQIIQTSAVLADEEEWMRGQAAEWVKGNVLLSTNNQFAKWSCTALIRMPIALQRRVIKLILSHLSLKKEAVSFRLIELLRKVMQPDEAPHQQVSVSADYRCIRVYDEIRMELSTLTETTDYAYEWDPLTRRRFMMPGMPGRLISEVVSADTHDSVKHFPPDRMVIPLPDGKQMVFIVRNRRAGDRMVWFQNGSRKKIKDAWIDAKWPLARRSVWPLVVSPEGEILWIPGFRITAGLPAAPEGKHKLVIRWEPVSEDAGFSDSDTT